MKSKFIYLIIILISLNSCVSNKLINSSINVTQVKKIAYFEPISYIGLVDKGNKIVPNDSLSLLSKKIIDTIIVQTTGSRISKKFEIKDSLISKNIEIETNNLINSIIKSNKIEGIKYNTKYIDSIMTSQNERFALSIIISGFDRRKGNYSGQVAKGAAIGILTLGMAVPVPIKSSIALYTIILDNEKKEVIYFAKTLPVEQSPTNKDAVKKKYIELFKGYFYK